MGGKCQGLLAAVSLCGAFINCASKACTSETACAHLMSGLVGQISHVQHLSNASELLGTHHLVHRRSQQWRHIAAPHTKHAETMLSMFVVHTLDVCCPWRKPASAAMASLLRGGSRAPTALLLSTHAARCCNVGSVTRCLHRVTAATSTWHVPSCVLAPITPDHHHEQVAQLLRLQRAA